MALEGKAHLHHTPAKQNQADGTDQGKDEGGEVIHHCQRVAGGKGGCGKAAEAQHHSDVGGKTKPPFSAERQSALRLVVLLGIS